MTCCGPHATLAVWCGTFSELIISLVSSNTWSTKRGIVIPPQTSQAFWHWLIRLEDATGLVELHLLCYPESDLAELLKGHTQQPDKAMDSNLIEVGTNCTIHISRWKEGGVIIIPHTHTHTHTHTLWHIGFLEVDSTTRRQWTEERTWW